MSSIQVDSQSATEIPGVGIVDMKLEEWYAPYISAREQGSTSEEATEAAALYMEGVR
jgi:hypothetical protein